MSEKGEYMLHLWGGFFNPPNKEKHHMEEGYFWFDTNAERMNFLKQYQDAEKKYDARYLAYDFGEGRHTHTRTVAYMIFTVAGKDYPFSYDFGYGYPKESAKYMFEEGNYDCDCNRSIFLGLPSMGCGHSIKMKHLKIRKEKP
jgi:hypothetical protein